MSQRRYYWLKLPEDFFRRPYLRRLRRMEDGDRLTVIYLEMLLAALKTDGVLSCAPGEDFAEELALELYEDADEVNTVLNYLSERGKLTRENDAEYHLTDSEELTGSERDSARRMRDLRRREEAAAALRETAAAEAPADPAPSPSVSADPAPRRDVPEPAVRITASESMTRDELRQLFCRKE